MAITVGFFCRNSLVSPPGALQLPHSASAASPAEGLCPTHGVYVFGECIDGISSFFLEYPLCINIYIYVCIYIYIYVCV